MQHLSNFSFWMGVVFITHHTSIRQSRTNVFPSFLSNCWLPIHTPHEFVYHQISAARADNSISKPMVTVSWSSEENGTSAQHGCTVPSIQLQKQTMCMKFNVIHPEYNETYVISIPISMKSCVTALLLTICAACFSYVAMTEHFTKVNIDIHQHREYWISYELETMVFIVISSLIDWLVGCLT